MANRKTYGLAGVKDQMQVLTAKLKGAGAANLVNTEAGNLGGGEIATATWNSTGNFSLTFRKTYPELKAVLGVEVVGTTTGLSGIFTALDVKAGTGTLQLSVGSVATDPASTDTIHLTWIVRNSGQNK